MTRRGRVERALSYYHAAEPTIVEADDDPDALARQVVGIDILIGTLNHQEQVVVRRRFGLTPDGTEHTLKACGAFLDVGRERARQILESALRKMRRHPMLAWVAPDAMARAEESQRIWEIEVEAARQARQRERQARWPLLDVAAEEDRYYHRLAYSPARSLDEYLTERQLAAGLAASIERGVARYLERRSAAQPDKESA